MMIWVLTQNMNVFARGYVLPGRTQLLRRAREAGRLEASRGNPCQVDRIVEQCLARSCFEEFAIPFQFRAKCVMLYFVFNDSWTHPRHSF